jgi:Phosphotransferase enzyme family
VSGEPLIHNRNNPVTDGVDRVGIATADGRPLTAVRKVLRGDGDVVVPHWTTADDPDHWNYWRREDLAYTSGTVDAFVVDGLRGPHLLDRVVRDDGSIELWLEDVRGRPGHTWEVVDHARCFGRLGAAQGRLGAGATPTDGWLSRRWLRSYSSSRPPGPAILDDDEAWDHPLVVEGFGPRRGAIRAGFRQLWADHDRWFGVVESLPQTLCHLDCWPRNLIAADDGTDVLIDWSFVGIGAIGEDPGNNVPDTFLDHFLEPDRFDELDDAVWTAYAGGLEAAGWPHPTDTARLGMVAAGVAKYLWLPGLMVGNVDLTTPTAYGGQDGYPLVEVFRRRAKVFEGLLRWAEEARARCANLAL